MREPSRPSSASARFLREPSRPSAASARVWLPVLALGLGACATTGAPPAVAPRTPAAPTLPAAPWVELGSEFAPRTRPAGEVLIRGGRILVGNGKSIGQGWVAIRNGVIAGVGEGPGDGQVGQDARIIDATGKVVTPGLIDTHSHLGVYPSPAVAAHQDGNEATAPVTAGVRAIDSVWADDPGFERALAGGVTTLQVLPGSANLVGGRAITLRLRRATHAWDMAFAGAPAGIKMACGENPKRVYGDRRQAPSTRMGNLAAQREAFLAAQRLRERWTRWLDAEGERQTKQAKAAAEYEAAREERRTREAWCAVGGDEHATRCAGWRKEWAAAPLREPEPSHAEPTPERDPGLELLAGVLDGRVLVHFHCYRAADLRAAMALADELGFSIRSFHHALEAYKVRDELAARHISVSTWADWWGFKLEAWDGIPENAALLHQAGVRTIIHSDSAEGIQRLNQEASKAAWSGIHARLLDDPGVALGWVTAEPAWALGIERQVGTLEVGKDADVVVWSDFPLRVYARAELVLVEGEERWSSERGYQPWSDHVLTDSPNPDDDPDEEAPAPPVTPGGAR